MKILVTGSAGFIGGYLVEDLLKYGHKVIGIDNFSKYGEIKKSYDKNKNYKFVKGNVKNKKLLVSLLQDCDHMVAGAAMIGGISYFHEYPYDLLAENERITASTFDAAIHAFKNFKLKKITVISSSMVFESTNKFPTPESEAMNIPPSKSTYGFQKLAVEYFAKGAYEQYELPFTIIRPFNCVGIGESKALIGKVEKGNIRLALSHVVPDLVQKILKGQYPLHIYGDGNQIRHYTYGADIAEGIRLGIFSKNSVNEDFNVSTNQSTTVLELAQMIWQKINPDKEFKYISNKPFKHDVQKRIPDTRKAKRILGFSAKTSLDKMLDELIPWIKEQQKLDSQEKH